MPPRQPTSIRLSEEVVRMLDELEAETGLKRSPIIDLAVREFYRRRKRSQGEKKNPRNPSD
jgi:predicted transcriptional regulator